MRIECTHKQSAPHNAATAAFKTWDNARSERSKHINETLSRLTEFEDSGKMKPSSTTARLFLKLYAVRDNLTRKIIQLYGSTVHVTGKWKQTNVFRCVSNGCIVRNKEN